MLLNQSNVSISACFCVFFPPVWITRKLKIFRMDLLSSFIHILMKFLFRQSAHLNKSMSTNFSTRSVRRDQCWQPENRIKCAVMCCEPGDINVSNEILTILLLNLNLVHISRVWIFHYSLWFSYACDDESEHWRIGNILSFFFFLTFRWINE